MSTTFKVGDRVRLKSDSLRFKAGETSEVVRVTDSSVGVKFDNPQGRGHDVGGTIPSGNGGWNFFFSRTDADMSNASRLEKMKPSQFEAGNKVKIVGAKAGHKFPIDSVVTITEYRGISYTFDQPYYRAESATGQSYLVLHDDIELAPEPAETVEDKLLAEIKRRIQALPASCSERDDDEDIEFDLLTDLLRVAGFKYREKPREPVKPEYEFAPL